MHYYLIPDKGTDRNDKEAMQGNATHHHWMRPLYTSIMTAMQHNVTKGYRRDAAIQSALRRQPGRGREVWSPAVNVTHHSQCQVSAVDEVEERSRQGRPALLAAICIVSPSLSSFGTGGSLFSSPPCPVSLNVKSLPFVSSVAEGRQLVSRAILQLCVVKRPFRWTSVRQLKT